MEQPLGLNETLLLWINQDWANPVFDFFFFWISEKYTFSIPLLAIIWITFGIKYGKKGWLLGALSILVTATGDLFGNFLKDIIQHPRPCLDMYALVRVPFDVSTPCSTSTSGMPSNHALNFFATFCFIAYFIRIRWVIIASITLSILVALSRVYLAKHYPAQIAVGSFIGCVYGLSIAWICHRYFKHRLPFISKP